jgi:hypothetical protein
MNLEYTLKLMIITVEQLVLLALVIPIGGTIIMIGISAWRDGRRDQMRFTAMIEKERSIQSLSVGVVVVVPPPANVELVTHTGYGTPVPETEGASCQNRL